MFFNVFSFFRKRKEELNGEVFEMLLTFSDFLAFKEMFIDYKRVSVFTCLVFTLSVDGIFVL